MKKPSLKRVIEAIEYLNPIGPFYCELMGNKTVEWFNMTKEQAKTRIWRHTREGDFDLGNPSDEKENLILLNFIILCTNKERERLLILLNLK